MIIKMEIECETKVRTDETISQPWRFIGDLENVERFSIRSIEDAPSADMFDEYYFGMARNAGFPTSVLIRAKRQNGKEIGILSNLSVYLLNDNGKTIERLN